MRNPEIGYAYMQKTFYGLDDLFSQGHGKEGDPGEPLKFKIYQGVPRYPLSQSLPLTLGDPRQAFADYAQETEAGRQLNLTMLSALLYYTFGFSRHDSGPGVSWPFHRLVPSARCFYPNELYLCIPAIDSLPAGIYHYDNLHHSLACLRQGDYREMLSMIVGADLCDSQAVLLVSAYFWKNAFRYRNFSYRLCSQEAGIVSGNTLLVAGTLGLRGALHYQFLDRAANHLLGLEPTEESLFAAIALGQAHSALPHSIPAPCTSTEILTEIEPISPHHIQSGHLDHELCSLFVELDQHSFLEDTSEFVTDVIDTTDTLSACSASEQRLLPPPPLKGDLELTEMLHRRHSADMFFLPQQRSLAQESFWEIIRYSTSPYRHDLSTQSSALRSQLYIAINDVEGLAQGVYRFCQHCNSLHTIEQHYNRQALLWLHNASAVHCHTAAMICFIVADYAQLSALYGNRAYRIMNMESGIIAQRLGVMSAAFGLAARCSDSYDIQRSEALLKLTDQPAMPVFLVAIGYERSGAGGRYRHKIRF